MCVASYNSIRIEATTKPTAAHFKHPKKSMVPDFTPNIYILNTTLVRSNVRSVAANGVAMNTKPPHLHNRHHRQAKRLPIPGGDASNLFRPQSDHRIDPGRASGRHEAGRCRDCGEQSGNGKVDGRIQRLHLVEDVLQSGGG